MFALVNEANKNVQFAVKTPTGLTKTAHIKNKIMQGDVLSPLLSSNMVDKNICKMAIFTKNTYMYKNQVEIPPLLMQDDTLAVSDCGYKTIKMNSFLNTHTNLMGLQFGRDKCVKLHVGKTKQEDVCPDCKVDAWKDVLVRHEDGHESLSDKYLGKEVMKNVQNKKYLGCIISNDMGNQSNIKEKTNRGVGIVNKIITTLYERPYGKYTYKAAALMREGLLLASILNNSESWINITKQDIEKLGKPDKMLIKNILVTQGNPSTVFMYLELGFLPVKYVIMKKRLNFLRYILNEDMETMLRKVYEVIKTDSRKGDFVDLVQQDLNDVGLEISENDIENTPKLLWKKIINSKVKDAALLDLVAQNSEKSKN